MYVHVQLYMYMYMYDAYSMHKVRYACCVCTICTICTAIVCVVSSSFATDFSTSPRNFLTSEAPQAKASQNCSARSAPANNEALYGADTSQFSAVARPRAGSRRARVAARSRSPGCLASWQKSRALIEKSGSLAPCGMSCRFQ